MGAEKINLDELRKAREELSAGHGFASPKPVQKEDTVDTSKSEDVSDMTFSAQNEVTNDDQTSLDEVDNYESYEVENDEADNSNLESKIDKITENIESESISDEKQKSEFDEVLLTLLNDSANGDEVDDRYNVDEIIEEVEKATDQEFADESSNATEQISNNTTEIQPEINVDIPQTAEMEPQPIIIPTNISENTANVDNFTQNPVDFEENYDDFELKPFYLPNIDVDIERKAEPMPAENFGFNPEVNPEQPVVNFAENPMGQPVIIPEVKEKINENALKKIEDAKFISLIRSKEFMGSDSLTCIYGVDEESNVFCQNFKDFYNTAIFTDNDDNIFELFSSIIMSLLLKNTNYDVKFAICDAKIGGKLSIYNTLSYMFFDRVAESNREITEALGELCLEIDSRYKTLAKAGANSIEKFNTEMKKANIAPMPYLLLFFNNYSRAYHLDDSNEINNKLSYILRFGRLVGVYANIVSFDENLVDNINFNLQTRIAYKTDLKETSISEIGEEGAENIAYGDEFIIKTLYSDKLIHLKAPKITQKEIELLIKNIEKK